MPKVSIIIPTHNRAELLQLAIKSVLGQTFQDFEIIIVDDASTDNMTDVVSAFKDERIKLFRRDVSGGDAVARNLGIANSKGEYIALLDDDDEWFPEKLQRQIGILMNSTPEIGAVYTGCIFIDIESQKILGVRYAEERGNIFSAILAENRINTSSVVLKRTCFEKVGLFDESIPWCSDQDMWIRISKEFQWECVRDTLVKYGEHLNKLTNHFGLKIKGKEKIIEKYKRNLLASPKAHTFHYLSLGIMYCLTGDTRKGREAYFKTLKLYPLNIKPCLYLCLSFLGAPIFKKVVEFRNRNKIVDWGGQVD